MKIRKLTILAAAALATMAALGTAGAADMPAPAYKAPPAPVATWTGCYVGAGGGYGWWRQDSFVQFSGVAITETETNAGNGWFGQGQVGCDYQFTAPLFNATAVIGIFGDYAAGHIDGNASFPGVVGPERESSTWSAGARLGVLIAPRILTYVDGGWTQAHFGQVDYNIAFPGGGPSGLSLAAQTYNGWFIGSGFEYSLDWLPVHGLFLKTEYRFGQFGGKDVPIFGGAGGIPAAGVTLNSKKQTEMASTELVWRFNWH
jgi:outer membrane immunogenic protein